MDEAVPGEMSHRRAAGRLGGPRPQLHRGIARAAGDGVHRPLLPAPGRSRSPDRGDRRRDGGARRGGKGPPHRPERGGAGDHSACERRSPDHRRAERVLAVDAATPRRRCCPPAASSGSDSCPTRRSGAASSPVGSPRRTSSTRTTSAAAARASPGENLEANLGSPKGQGDRGEKGVTPAQLAIAWVLARGDDLVPIPGTKRRTYLEQNAGAVDVELTADDLARIDAELPEPPASATTRPGWRR